MSNLNDLKSLFVQRDRLTKLIGSLAEILGISIAIADEKGNFMLEPAYTIEACRKVHQAAEGKDNCQQEAFRLVEEIKRSKKSLVLRCHANFFKFASPLIYHDNFLGVIFGCRTKPPEAPCEQDTYLEGLIAPVTEIVNMYINDELELISLTKELVSNYTEISLLYEMGEIFAKSLDEKEAAKIVLERILDLTEAERISLMLLDPKTNKLKIVYSRGIPEEIVKNTLVQFGDAISGGVAKNGKPLLVENINDNPQLKSRSASRQEQFKTHSFVSAPLITSLLKVEEKVIGVINIADKKSGEPFTQHDLNLLSAISAQIAALIENKRLFSDIKDLFLTTIKALSLALDAKDHYTYGHAQEVTKCALAICEELNLSEDLKSHIEMASILHDIGKIAVPESILLKPGKLTEKEIDEVRKHPVKGAAILQDIKQLTNIIPAILYHHERFDGTGYPMGLKGDQIPLMAKILSVADAYDAMISERSYRPALSKEEAISEIKKNTGTQFDPQITEAFLRAYEKGKI